MIDRCPSQEAVFWGESFLHLRKGDHWEKLRLLGTAATLKTSQTSGSSDTQCVSVLYPLFILYQSLFFNLVGEETQPQDSFHLVPGNAGPDRQSQKDNQKGMSCSLIRKGASPCTMVRGI